jgi:hypothetical protein
VHHDIVIGCRVVAYVRTRTNMEMITRAGRDILFIGGIVSGGRAGRVGW